MSQDLERRLLEMERRLGRLDAQERPMANEGAAFPTAGLYTGRRFFRTDRGIEYYYDGTRWLSTEILCMPPGETRILGSATGTGSTGVVYLSTFPKTPGIATASQPGIWIVDIQARILTLTTLNSTNYWVLTVQSNGGSGADTHWTQNSYYEYSPGNFTVAGTTYDYQSGELDSADQPAADQTILFFSIAKNNAPGNWGGNVIIYYRLVG